MIIREQKNGRLYAGRLEAEANHEVLVLYPLRSGRARRVLPLTADGLLMAKATSEEMSALTKAGFHFDFDGNPAFSESEGPRARPASFWTRRRAAKDSSFPH